MRILQVIDVRNVDILQPRVVRDQLQGGLLELLNFLYRHYSIMCWVSDEFVSTVHTKTRQVGKRQVEKTVPGVVSLKPPDTKDVPTDLGPSV